MLKHILVFTCLLSSLAVLSQAKENKILVNETQKKLIYDFGSSANMTWYTICEKVKDSVLQQTFIHNKNNIKRAMDSLLKIGFVPKFRKQNISDIKVSLKLAEHKFYKTDSIKKAPGKVTVDSVFIVKIVSTIVSEKEKINKTRYYAQKYTTLNKFKLEEKIKKYKEFSLSKYTGTDIFELQFLFAKFLMVNPLSFYASFDADEKEFF